MKNVKKVISAVALLNVFFLASCGGGGGAGAAGEDSSSNIPVSVPSSFQKYSYGYTGPMAIEDFDNDGTYELLGGEQESGLGAIRANGRQWRDIRFADFDNDGRLDAIANVYSENINNDPSYGSWIQLYWGVEGGKFQLDEAFEARHYTGYGETIVVADFDNNGYTDIVIPQYKIPNSSNIYSRNLLFKNNGNRLFEEVAESSGVAETKYDRAPEGAMAVDINSDGYIDLYVGGSLFINLGGFLFHDMTDDYGLPGVFEEGAKFFDYEMDGDLDFIINPGYSKPRLFLNKGGLFEEADSKIFPSEYFDSVYGINLGDVDNDGLDDLVLAGGYGLLREKLAPRLYLNRDGKFVRQNLDLDGRGWSDLVSFLDLNNDGALDILARHAGMTAYINNKLPSYFIRLSVLGEGRRNQHGRVVRVVYSNDKVKALVVDGGSGYMANQSYELIIPNNGKDNLRIEVRCFNGNKIIHAIEGRHSIDCAL